MNRLLRITLTALILVHATVGCCIHHAYSCQDSCIDLPAGTADSCSGHDHSSPGEGSQFSDDPGHRHDSHHCDPCTFVLTKSRNADFVNMLGPMLSAAGRKLTTNRIPAVAIHPGAGAHAQRSYLRYSVLLI